METRPKGGQRFSREPGMPRLVAETSELLTRLERHAAESGRLEGVVETLEQALKAERDARRRLVDRMRRERAAAEALHERAERAEAAQAAAAQEVHNLTEAASRAEHQTQLTWAQLAVTERALALKTRPLWRKLLRRPPRDS